MSMKNNNKTFKHLCEKERFVIESLLRVNTSIRGIAEVLDRSPNTISNEIRRNIVNGIYVSNKANQKAYMKRYRAKRMCLKVAMDSFLYRFVEEKLRKRWSPKQMSGYLRRMNINVSSKAIYKFIYQRGLDYLLFNGWNKLKTGRKRYSYNNPKDERKYIDERPSVVGLGHFEMDFIVSKHNSFVLFVVVDMVSKYTRVLKLPNRKRSTILGALAVVFNGVKVESLTTDNDIAFVCWRDIESLLHTQVYFTHPYHSWEKGLVENTNRWIRCFVKKRRDIETITEKELQEIHSFLNHRPREIIDFRTPFEVYYKLESVLIEG